MRSTFKRWFLATGVALALAVPALAQDGPDITNVIPDVATVGTEITITGQGFGEKKPKVLTVADAPGAKIAADKWKVTESSDTQIKAVLKKPGKGLGAGSRTLQVIPKKQDAIVEVSALRVEAPQIDDVTPPASAPKQEVTINGNHFGTKKGKVFVGNVVNPEKKKPKEFWPAKVLEWTNDRIRVRLHKKLPDGLHGVRVVNKVEETSTDDLVTTTSPISGGDFLTARAVGTFKASKDTIVVTEQGGGLAISGAMARRDDQMLNITVPLPDPLDQLTLPLTIDDCTIILGQTIIDRRNPLEPQVNGWSTDTGTVTITNASGGRVSFTFEGDLDRTQGNGDQQVNLRSGQGLGTILQP